MPEHRAQPCLAGIDSPAMLTEVQAMLFSASGRGNRLLDAFLRLIHAYSSFQEDMVEPERGPDHHSPA